MVLWTWDLFALPECTSDCGSALYIAGLNLTVPLASCRHLGPLIPFVLFGPNITQTTSGSLFDVTDNTGSTVGPAL